MVMPRWSMVYFLLNLERDVTHIHSVNAKRCKVDTSILHHAFISIFIALWVVITRYFTILMDILSYFIRFIMKRENVGSWDSGWNRSKYWKPILHSSKSPETP